MIFVFDRDETLKAVLRRDSPESMPYWETAFTEQLNGDVRFKFHIPADHEDAQYVEKESRIVIRDDDGNERLLVVRETEEKRTQDDRVRKFVYCKDAAIAELNDAPIEKISLQATTPAVALAEVLKNSRYQPGIVDSFEPKDFSIEMKNAMYGLQQMIETWGGEIRYRVVVSGNKIAFRYVDFLTRRGENKGKRFEYRKDIQEIIRKVSTKHLKTAIYPLGKSVKNDDGTEEKLTIADVEWSTANGDPVDKPLGQKWIGDPNALAQWGYLNSDGSRSHRFGFYENNDIEDPNELIQVGWDYLQNSGITQPEVTYEMTVLTLERLTGYEHEAVRLGDTVYVIDRGFKKPIEIEARVIELERDWDKPKNSRVVLGNFIPTFIDTVNDIRRETDRRLRPIERVNFLNSIIDLENNLIASSNGYVYIDNPNGITIYNKPKDQNPDQAMQLNSAGFRIAGSKDPNTGEFNWKTFGTFNGFTADLINAGTLNASLVNVISESSDRTRTVRIGDGNVYSYDNNDLSMRFGSYRLELFDTLNKEKLGHFGVAYLIEDVERRGMAWVGEQSFISIDKYVDGVLRSFFEADFESNILYLSGGWSGNQSGTASVTIVADEWVWGTGGGGYRMTDQAAIRMFRQSDGSFVYIYYGDSYSSNASSSFEIRENATATTYRTMIRCADNSITLYPRVYLGSSRVGWVEGTSNSVRLGAGSGTDHYIYVLDNGNIYFKQNGVITNSFWADGTKNTGIIEIDGKRWGMSPIDSPQYLIEYVVFDQDVTEDGITVELDAKYVQAVENYAVFPSRGDVSITDKTPTSFTVKGPTGKVDLRIVGIRIGKLDAFWEDIEVRASEGTLMKTISIQQEQQEKIDPEAIKKQAKPIKRPGYGRKEGDQ